MKFLELADGAIVELEATGDMPEPVHQFNGRQIRAVNAALAARRPLLVRGEPGIGKSQLARAAAAVLKRAFVSYTVDASTESRDLLWHFDAVERLAKAQLIGAMVRAGDADAKKSGDASDPSDRRKDLDIADLRKELDVENFLHPRALWWAFNWKNARGQAKRVGAHRPPKLDGGDPANGCVVLIDEIDKAEADVPNGLLEALGSGCFTPQGLKKPIRAQGVAPLVIITTNGERALPDAFVRRCLVLHLRLPSDEEKLLSHLKGRGVAHFRSRANFNQRTSVKVLVEAAKQLIKDRRRAEDNHWLPLPGQAEYLDLVRAVVTCKDDTADQLSLMHRLNEFVLKKHPDAFRQVPEQDDEA